MRLLRKNLKLLSLFTLLLVLFAFQNQSAYAFDFSDLFTDLKNFINHTGSKPGNLTIDSEIALAPDGDINKNNEIDAGDIVRFTYTLRNTTNKSYSFGTLETNIERKQFNFFHNLIGANNLVDDNKTIKISNVRINPGEALIMSFDARTLYRENDIQISTEAEFIDSDHKSLIKSVKLEKLVKNNIPDFIPRTKLEKR